MQEQDYLVGSPQRSVFPAPPPVDGVRWAYRSIVSTVVLVAPLIVLLYLTGATAPPANPDTSLDKPSLRTVAIVFLTALTIASACHLGLTRQSDNKAVAALALNVADVVRTYTDGAAPMFEIDDAVALVLADPSYVWGLRAARLDLYVMHSPSDDAQGSTARAVYTRDQAERIWPRLFGGSTAWRDRRRLFNYTVRVPTTRRVGTSPIGDVCTISVHTALHPVDAFAYALDTGVAVSMATDRLVRRHLQDAHERRLERQRGIWREIVEKDGGANATINGDDGYDNEKKGEKCSGVERPSEPCEAETTAHAPPLFAAPPMTH
ncbi:hypothetical protein [Pandoravirus japonicus]|uniref:Uncharacterized protein n=1 Tax=Pandoravirus japonicus TaxID=2823154 RepID=A0A811BMM4_9VIRU|nr:hypothetical protein [Pandoravirus japonicus]